jgi:DNA-binding MarR family transcriptional regulator
MNNHDILLDNLYTEMSLVKRTMMVRRGQMLGELSLTRTQVEVLNLLDERIQLSVSELAVCLAVTHSATTQTIEALVKRGLVERRADDHDRRIVQVLLSKEGKRLAAQQQASRREWLKTTFGSLRDDELEVMITVMKKMASHVTPSATTNHAE